MSLLYIHRQGISPDLTLRENEMNATKIITNTTNSLGVKKIAKEKGWTKAESFQKVFDYVHSGSKLNIIEWLNNA